MMSLRQVLQKILTEYVDAQSTTFAANPLARFIRSDAPAEIAAAVVDKKGNFLIEGSAGAGNWAEIPWVAVFDPSVTNSATKGHYVVYLFNCKSGRVCLSLNQGTTAVREAFGNETRDVLKARAHLMRQRILEYAAQLPDEAISLGSAARLPGDYQAGHILGTSYAVDDLPSDQKLASDLRIILAAYRSLTFRTVIEGESQSDAAEFGIGETKSIIEKRRYAFHRKLERNGSAARQAKKFHGSRCQACDLDFAERYGSIGAGFIEAHHLRPISTLVEGEPVTYDIATDFAVLCSNCHRMIHRMPDPSDLASFSAKIKKNRADVQQAAV